MMPKLDLPEFPVRIRAGRDRKSQIFDQVRKKFVRLTPEEWVRQHILNFLISHLDYPAALIHVEAPLTYNRLRKRSDIVVYGKEGKPLLAVECKSPSVFLTQKVFDQLAGYNFSFRVPFLLITNGMSHYCCLIDWERKTYSFVQEIPSYRAISEYRLQTQ